MVKMLSGQAAAQPSARVRLLVGGILSLVASGLLVATAPEGGRLGAPAYWAWLLTALQVLALWAAGRHRSWGWLLGAAVQPVWITYALLTGQVGFIPGCAVSAAVQARSFLRPAAITLGLEESGR